MHGNYSYLLRRADMELENTCPVPGSHLLIATAAPHHGQAFGSLVGRWTRVRRMTTRWGRSGGSRRKCRLPGKPEGSQTYGTAWPLNDTMLCAYEPVEVKGTGQRHLFGLYLVDAFGNKELIYRYGLRHRLPEPRSAARHTAPAGDPRTTPARRGLAWRSHGGHHP